MAKPKVVIIGGGAAGVFTAYWLERIARGHFDITILEWCPKVGGHTDSGMESEGSEQVRIDYGAQFFSEEAQPAYCAMLRHEGLFTSDIVLERDAGITIFHATRDRVLFRLPDNPVGILLETIKEPARWLCFAHMVDEAKDLYATGSWETTFGEWVAGLDFWFVDAATATAFKRDVVRPCMYQFGLVPPDALDALSAKFVVYYFVASLPKKPDLSPFTVHNSLIGLDGVHERLLHTYCDIKVDRNRKVTSLSKSGNTYDVGTDVGGPFQADEVVFAINPCRALDIVPETAAYARLRDVLKRMPYIFVTVCIQKGLPTYMPTQERYWSVSNVIVADTDPGTPQPSHYMLTVWFGRLRGERLAAKFFKSWGSPELYPSAPCHRERTHELMVGTPSFIAARKELRSTLQSVDGLWFSGGYLWGYDSQNACLNSARRTANGILERYGLPIPLAVQPVPGIGAASPGDREEDDLPTSDRVSPFSEAIRDAILTLRPDHAATQAWLKGQSQRD